jgi:hypothetical protein
MDVNCLGCGGLLFNEVPLDDKGNWAIDVKTPATLGYDERDMFYRCQHCSVKNVVMDSISLTGLPMLRISHTK